MTKSPDYHLTEEFQNRSQKLQDLRKIGIEAYPHTYTPTHTSEQLHTTYDKSGIGSSEDAEQGKTPYVSVAGRLILFRSMGKNAFATLQDRDGRIQFMLNKDNSELHGLDKTKLTEATGGSALKFIEKKVDLGDIVGVEGFLFHTQKGELTIYVRRLHLLSKSLLPLPEKHAGLQDIELRYRKRWLDLITNPATQNTFRKRSKIVTLVRNYFENSGFLEVETPVLQTIYGGAQARPFTSHFNALNQDMFLRISLEIPLKKLLVGGMDRIFEIGKVFRNEGIDRNHNPEFTMLEAYAAMWDYNDMMRLVENLFEHVALALNETTVCAIQQPGSDTPAFLDFKTPWKRMTMKESIKEYGHFDVDLASEEEMRTKLIAHGMTKEEVQTCSKGLLIAHLFETLVEHQLIQPHHITDHPIETTPLCKPHREEAAKQQGLIERFETFILGQEICNAYSELNDPELQRELLEEQANRKALGDEEANPLDEDFIEAICQGMPPTGGLGIGIDRMVMLFTGAHSIRDVLYFPAMKPLS